MRSEKLRSGRTTVATSTPIATHVHRSLSSKRLHSNRGVLRRRLTTQCKIDQVPLQRTLGRLRTRNLIIRRPGQNCFITRLQTRSVRRICQLHRLLRTRTVRTTYQGLDSITVSHVYRLTSRIRLTLSANSLNTVNPTGQTFRFTIFRTSKVPHLAHVLGDL